MSLKDIIPYQFKPGQSGNPKGRPPGVDPILRKMTREERAELYNKLMHMSINELREFVQDPDVPINELIIAKALLTDLKNGSLDSYERLLERVIGKVPQKNELTGADGTPLEAPSIHFAPFDPDKVPIQPATPTPPTASDPQPET